MLLTIFREPFQLSRNHHLGVYREWTWERASRWSWLFSQKNDYRYLKKTGTCLLKAPNILYIISCQSSLYFLPLYSCIVNCAKHVLDQWPTSSTVRIQQYKTVYNTIQQYTTLYNSIQQYTAVYNSIQQYTTLYNSIQQYTTVYNSIQQYTTVYNSMQQYTTVY